MRSAPQRLSRAAAVAGDGWDSPRLGGGSIPCAAALALLVLFHNARAVHGAEEPDLMQTLVAEDATLNNNLDLFDPRWVRNKEGSALSFGFGLEKMISPKMAVAIGGEWDAISPRSGHSAGGFGSVEVLFKYVFLSSPENEFQAAVVPSISFPTNSHIGDETTPPSGGFALSWGGRLSGISAANWSRYLRAIEFQGDLGYTHSLGLPSGDEIYFDPVIDYSFPYLVYAGAAAVPWPLHDLCFFSELNLARSLSGGSSAPSIFLTPGIAYLRAEYQLSIGVQIALNHTASREQQVGIIGSVLLSLDALNPVFARMPL
jgi:hypothetical protein